MTHRVTTSDNLIPNQAISAKSAEVPNNPVTPTGIVPTKEAVKNLPTAKINHTAERIAGSAASLLIQQRNDGSVPISALNQPLGIHHRMMGSFGSTDT
ncbi:hypothetical protein GCM10007415_14350 [Parapedobacter pyrenivorans]|uniref:Uncharacterized protein n=1 Tax=Parapedobacter pyrenivorans TaxID=1305674 RepID=A0A917M8V8_9SPHI|nr:hypothetical protein GCM10007415_14350 [Parapedobacter pyrenivorans]